VNGQSRTIGTEESATRGAIEGARDVPKLINYQGYLKDSSGNALTDSAAMDFAIYDDPSAGSLLWSESQDVEVVDGVFNILLGSTNPIPDNVFTTGTDRWLQVTVEGEIMAPRTRVAAVAYAYTSTHSDTASYALSGPSGGGGWIDDGTVVRLENVNDSVGIGTTNPQARLHVAGGDILHGGKEIRVVGDVSAVESDLYFYDAGGLAAEDGLWFFTDADDDDSVPGGFHFSKDAEYVYDPNRIELMTILETGDVGIGTSPTEKFEVAGTIYSSLGGFKFPDGTSQVSAAAGDGHSLDAADGSPDDALYVDAYGNVGIGTTNPAAALDIQGELNVGEDDSGYEVNFYGGQSGGRFYWEDWKMALRAGRDSDGTHWNYDSIGFYSFATNVNTKATGYAAVAMGTQTNASGSHSTAMGFETIASEDNAVAMGEYSEASASEAVAMGIHTTASGVASVAMGNGSVASGTSSMAMGLNTLASEYATLATGLYSSANGSYSHAMGCYADANGESSTVLGRRSSANGTCAMALGRFVTADTANCIVLGTGVSNGSRLINGIEQSLVVGFNTTQPTLFVGGGDHRVGIGTTNPGQKLHITDDIIIGGDALADGTSEFIRIQAKADEWYVGVENETDPSDADFCIGKAMEDGTFHIRNDGNVGIGTTNPSADLELTTQDSTQLKLGGSANTGSNASGYKLLISGYDNDDTLYTYPIYVIDENDKVDFWLRSKMDTDSSSTAYYSGRVGIGTTSPERPLHIDDVMRLSPRSTFPSSPSDGDLCIVGSTGNRHVYCYLNDGWQQLD
jgi:hypothetical protein